MQESVNRRVIVIAIFALSIPYASFASNAIYQYSFEELNFFAYSNHEANASVFGGCHPSYGANKILQPINHNASRHLHPWIASCIVMSCLVGIIGLIIYVSNFTQFLAPQV